MSDWEILYSGCVFLLVNYRLFSMLLHTNWFRNGDEETSAFILDFYSCPSNVQLDGGSGQSFILSSKKNLLVWKEVFILI